MMKKFEYMLVSENDQLFGLDNLNKLGSEGWELVSQETIPVAYQSILRIYTFKREVPEVSATTNLPSIELAPEWDLKKNALPGPVSSRQLYNFLRRIHECTELDKQNGGTVDRMLRNTTEELGELAAALTVEDGLKPHKTIREDSRVEAVDLLICAMSVFFAKNGTFEDLVRIGNEKLNKWEKNIVKKEPNGQ